MAKNLEIKAYCSDIYAIEPIAKNIATKFIGIDHQIDTYFKTKTGRIKLRESSVSGTYLIPYLRANQSKAKISLYEKIDIPHTKRTKEILTQILGLHCVVEKKRTIYLYHNVRIHLDDVKNLGHFIELEAVFSDSQDDEIDQQQKIDFLMSILKIKENMLVASSYENLIIRKNIK